MGLTAEQLPEIEFHDSPDFKQYPDKITRETQQDGDDIVGLVNRSIAVIATTEGELLLPSINLKWWNIVSGKLVTTQLPEKTITVVADPTAISQVAANPSDNYAAATSTTANVQTTNSDNSRNDFWILTSILLLAGWAITLVYFLRKIKIEPGKDSMAELKSRRDETSNELLIKIKQACKHNDAGQTRKMLQAWAKSRWPNSSPKSLQEISQRLKSTELANELIVLDKYLYADSKHGNGDIDPMLIAGEAAAWSGDELHQLLTTLPQLKQRKQKQPVEILPRLYPKWQ